MISADHLVSYLSDVLFGCRVTAVLYTELNSEKIYGLEIQKKVNFLWSKDELDEIKNIFNELDTIRELTHDEIKVVEAHL